MWVQLPTDTFSKQLKKWPKKHSRELAAMLANLQTVLLALQCGATVESLTFGFVHREPGGVLALDQEGGGAGLKQSRLYVYPHKPSQIFHLITLGDKSTQPRDIAYARAYVDGLKGSDEGGSVTTK